MTFGPSRRMQCVCENVLQICSLPGLSVLVKACATYMYKGSVHTSADIVMLHAPISTIISLWPFDVQSGFHIFTLTVTYSLTNNTRHLNCCVPPCDGPHVMCTQAMVGVKGTRMHWSLSFPIQLGGVVMAAELNHTLYGPSHTQSTIMGYLIHKCAEYYHVKKKSSKACSFVSCLFVSLYSRPGPSGNHLHQAASRDTAGHLWGFPASPRAACFVAHWTC